MEAEKGRVDFLLYLHSLGNNDFQKRRRLQEGKKDFQPRWWNERKKKYELSESTNGFSTHACMYLPTDMPLRTSF